MATELRWIADELAEISLDGAGSQHHTFFRGLSCRLPCCSDHSSFDIACPPRVATPPSVFQPPFRFLVFSCGIVPCVDGWGTCGHTSWCKAGLSANVFVLLQNGMGYLQNGIGCHDFAPGRVIILAPWSRLFHQLRGSLQLSNDFLAWHFQ